MLRRSEKEKRRDRERPRMSKNQAKVAGIGNIERGIRVILLELWLDSRTLHTICANSIVLFCLPLAILPNLLVSVLEKNSR